MDLITRRNPHTIYLTFHAHDIGIFYSKTPTTLIMAGPISITKSLTTTVRSLWCIEIFDASHTKISFNHNVHLRGGLMRECIHFCISQPSEMTVIRDHDHPRTNVL